MKKLIAKVFGVELHANPQNINGKKSSGTEDASCYSNWKALTPPPGRYSGEEWM